ncbi:nucleoid-associated protein [Streptococcus sp. S784/96/1]|uniref:nucleoid-associated protein n=1 Tax=Streptococcus sp. S784/96/1 TaxID=2653499 RepID=UPI00138693DD|nr:nucleoid-associated protein [Streptococcus sp. S784/96/1]
MKKKIAVYEISDVITEIPLDETKIFNIARIFNKIMGEGAKSTAHSTILAEIKSDQSILAQYSKDKDKFSVETFAQRLLETELNNYKTSRKKNLKEGFLFIRESDKDLILLKLEKTSVADTETFELLGQLGTDKHYYKACIFTNDLYGIAVIDKSRKVASYWLEDFLDLQEVRNSKVNSDDLIELVENEELFSEEIKDKDNFSEIISETKSYIFDNKNFDKSELIEFLNQKNIVDIDTQQTNYEELFFSRKSSTLDASFVIDQKVLRSWYHGEIKISDETVIKTANFEKLKKNKLIKLRGNTIILKISDEFIEEVAIQLGNDNG